MMHNWSNLMGKLYTSAMGTTIMHIVLCVYVLSEYARWLHG